MSKAQRTERLEARTTPATLTRLKQAAKSQGRSVSDFVIDAAARAAERELEQAKVIQLSALEQQRFVDALLSPPKPTAAWRRAKAAHAKLIRTA